jgi:hypothetical protein
MTRQFTPEPHIRVEQKHKRKITKASDQCKYGYHLGCGISIIDALRKGPEFYSYYIYFDKPMDVHEFERRMLKAFGDLDKT